MAKDHKGAIEVTQALQLTEYIVKDGNARFIRDLHKNIFVVRALQDYNHFSENTDRGKPIRSLARRVSELLLEAMKNIDGLMNETKQKFTVSNQARGKFNEYNTKERTKKGLFGKEPKDIKDSSQKLFQVIWSTR